MQLLAKKFILGDDVFVKKLSLLIALVLCVTIGGVYATWNYAQGEVIEVQSFLLPQMETVVTSGEKGTISIDTSALTMKIDDIADGTAHNAALIVDGKITVTFTPSAGADETVTTSGVKMQATITCTNGWNYNNTAIFTIDTTKNVIETGTEVKSFEITADQLKEIISLNPVELPTYSDYQAFETELNRGNIKIVVNEVE